MTAPFDRPPGGHTRTGERRLIGLDVARAVALIGVVVMNYHGMLLRSGRSTGTTSLIDRIFDIRTGVLSTRFAATFVVVAGIGVTLLTDAARRSGTRNARIDARLRLVRRGSVLVIGGFFLDLAWPGTILFYYGVFFVLAAFIFHLSSRHLVLLAGAIVVATIGVSAWRRDRLVHGDATTWVDPPDIGSIQDFLARAFLGYTHPVLPWFSFLLIGMVLGRHLDACRAHARQLMSVLTGVIAGIYLVVSLTGSSARSVIPHVVTSMHPDERGLAYIVSTAGIALVCVLAIFAIAERFSSNIIVVSLQRAGQLSLSLYLGHVLFYYVFAQWSGWNIGSELVSATTLALSYWTIAIVAGSWWQRRVGPGPAESLYRRLGG